MDQFKSKLPLVAVKQNLNPLQQEKTPSSETATRFR